MERNQVIGFLLIMLMLIGYQWIAPKPVTPPKTEVAVSKTAVKATRVEAVPAAAPDSTRLAATYGTLASNAVGEEQTTTIETEDLRIVFTNKGGRISELELKKYKTYDQKPIYLVSPTHSALELNLPTTSGEVNLSELYFTTSSQNQALAPGDSAVITYRVATGENAYFEQVYVVRGEGYLIDYNLRSSGLGIGSKSLRFSWKNDFLQLENDMEENRKAVQIDYFTDELSSVGSGSPSSTAEEKLEEEAKWVTLKHKYFLKGLAARQTPLKEVQLKAEATPEDTAIVKILSMQTSIPMQSLQKGEANYYFYFGPNDYHTLKKLPIEEFEQNVYLGYAFLKPINKFVLVPLFNFLEGFVSNYGLLIILLVLIVKLALTPLTYKSYVSMAKMRVLAPDLEEIRKANPDDAAKQQQEQMKLYSEVGVSPLSGCIPVLATMPILFSLFFLFPNLIELRQQSFLWAPDLSTYDSIVTFPFKIPFMGSHLSLFTLLMTVSSIAYAYYNNQITPTQPGPINMKFLGYVMPLMFMFVLNSFPAGLTFYYFVSNVVTIAQQLVIRRFVDEDKIKQILEENKKKNVGKPKQNKFQKYLEKSLQAAEEAKKRQEEVKATAKTKRK